MSRLPVFTTEKKPAESLSSTDLLSPSFDPAIFATANRKRELFIKVLKEEFLRELQFIWDVANKRATARDTMTQKIVKPLLMSVAVIPWAGTVIKGLAKLSEFAINQTRDKRIEMIAKVQSELDLERLSILLDVVAREALRRYETIIVDRLSDTLEEGVIPFAKAGARRMVERLTHERYIGQSGLELIINESLLLAGLVEGQSGAWIEGFFNHTLVLKKTERNWMGRTRHKTIDAEDIYGRAGLRCLEMQHGELIDKLYVREKAAHQQVTEWKKVKALIAGEKEPFGNFGYVRFRQDKGYQQDPEVGYVIMPLEVIRGRYDFASQERKVLSKDLEMELRASSHSIIQVDRTTIAKYLIWSRTAKSKGLVDYVREVMRYPGITTVMCADDLTSLVLTGANLSHTDFTGAILGGDLSRTDFSDSYLIGAVFKGVTSARGMILRRARCECLDARKVDFQGSDLTQANFSHAQLTGANLTACKILGTLWQAAELTGIQTDKELLREQKQHMQQLETEIAAQREQLRDLEKLTQTQTQALKTIQDELAICLQPHTSEQLQSLVVHSQHLVQQHESRLVFEAHCQQTIRQLQQDLKQATDKTSLSQLETRLQDTQQQLQELQAAKNFQEEIKQFQDECQTQITGLGMQAGELQKKVSGLEKRLTAECQVQIKQQGERLNQLENKVNAIEKDLKEQIAQLTKRVNVLEQWAQETKQILKEEKNDKEHVKTAVKELNNAVSTLLSEQKGHAEQQKTQAQQIQQIHDQIAKTAKQDEVLALKIQLESMQKQLTEMKVVDKSTIITRPLWALQKEFASQKGQVESVCRSNPKLKTALQSTLAQIEQRQQTIATVMANFETRWDQHVTTETQAIDDLRDFLTQTYSACDARIEELNKRVTVLERWATQTDQCLESFVSDQKDVQSDLAILKKELAKLIEQQQTQHQQQQQSRQELLALQAGITHTHDSKAAFTIRTKLQSLEAAMGEGFTVQPDEQIEARLHSLRAYYTKQVEEMTAILDLTEGDAREALESAQTDIQQKLAQLTEIETSLQTGKEQQQKIDEDVFATLKRDITQAQDSLTKQIEKLGIRMDKAEEKIVKIGRDTDPRFTVANKLLTLRQKILADEFITAELSCYVAPNGQSQLGSEVSDPLYAWIQKEFLNGDCKVLLLQGLPGSGKSTFNRHLLRQLWQDPAWQTFKPGDLAPKVRAPLFAPLGSAQVDPGHLFDYLRDLPELVEQFTETEIGVLKTDYQLLWIADGYDEIPGYPKENMLNIYDSNFTKYQERIKLLISCRPLPKELAESTYFMSHQSDGKLERGSYRTRYVAPFTPQQRVDYIGRYLKKMTEDPERKQIPLLPNPAAYEKEFADIPTFKDLINTPFLLMIAVEVLPAILQKITKAAASQTKKDSASLLGGDRAALTQTMLFDKFVENWFIREARKAWASKNFLKDPEALWGTDWYSPLKAAIDTQEDDPKIYWLKHSYSKFCEEFALNLRDEKRVSIQYPPEVKHQGRGTKKGATEKAPATPEWVENLFKTELDENGDMRRSLRGCPIIKNPSNEYGFIHPSLIAHFEAKVVFDCETQPDDEFARSSPKTSSLQPGFFNKKTDKKPVTTQPGTSSSRGPTFGGDDE